MHALTNSGAFDPHAGHVIKRISTFDSARKMVAERARAREGARERGREREKDREQEWEGQREGGSGRVRQGGTVTAEEKTISIDIPLCNQEQ